ncbi:hypothetical protein, unlikely [Trypanosoma brucei gambiense DAL972]|uniref:Uncharacterized protein n=1 Tax=Trypanosoma brucei gambiense (strain MHOM/CI/86/DAL972) TaxID=679716 RepID=C9ZN40_TRYB9|nr:hypothetical protein, unlikely [Trypanosoma brucei gambiense DAL972]CBH10694.1 hypothetical protein, unlikely [Trypanosoma brucei gambiense DAL972]|eukprot:XP_011772982.1 hypothetical protein, unlikely [Trypanosoma brucei gambiense DAL972]
MMLLTTIPHMSTPHTFLPFAFSMPGTKMVRLASNLICGALSNFFSFFGEGVKFIMFCSVNFYIRAIYGCVIFNFVVMFVCDVNALEEWFIFAGCFFLIYLLFLVIYCFIIVLFLLVHCAFELFILFF